MGLMENAGQDMFRAVNGPIETSQEPFKPGGDVDGSLQTRDAPDLPRVQKNDLPFVIKNGLYF